jgi:hypothetical protein
MASSRFEETSVPSGCNELGGDRRSNLLGGKSALARDCGARWAKASIYAGLRMVHSCGGSYPVQQEERHE